MRRRIFTRRRSRDPAIIGPPAGARLPSRVRRQVGRALGRHALLSESDRCRAGADLLAHEVAAVYSHIVVFGGAQEADILARARPGYAGRVLLGQDLMSVAVGDTVATARPRATGAAPRP